MLMGDVYMALWSYSYLNNLGQVSPVRIFVKIILDQVRDVIK